MALALSSRRFTVEEFERMAAMGIFGADERVELLEGIIVPMTPIGDRHIGCVNYLQERLTAALLGRAVIQVQSAVRLSANWAPQPDVAVLRRRADYYRTGKAQPRDILLLIEVSDSSASDDREWKLPGYAQAGLPEVWLVDLLADVIVVARDPGPQGLGVLVPHARGATLSVPGFPEVTLTVDEVLGPPAST